MYYNQLLPGARDLVIKEMRRDKNVLLMEDCSGNKASLFRAWTSSSWVRRSASRISCLQDVL